MPLIHDQIIQRLNDGLVFNYPEVAEAHICGDILKFPSTNTASLDIHLGKTILVERYSEQARPISYRKREKLPMREVDVTKPYALRPPRLRRQPDAGV